MGFGAWDLSPPIVRRWGLTPPAESIHALLDCSSDGRSDALTNQPPDLLPGTLDMLILRTLGRGALHGYAIAVADPPGLG